MKIVHYDNTSDQLCISTTFGDVGVDHLINMGVIKANDPYIIVHEDPVCKEDPEQHFLMAWEFDNTTTPPTIKVNPEKAAYVWKLLLAQESFDRIKFIDQKILQTLSSTYDVTEIKRLQSIKDQLINLPEKIQNITFETFSDVIEFRPMILNME